MKTTLSVHNPLKNYIVGFCLSLALTMAAYLAVVHHVNSRHISPSDNVMVGALAVLAITQLFTQLYFFLHLGQEKKPRWNLISLLFAILVVLILVIGSIWIMYNLSYNTMSPHQLDQSIIKDENVHPH